MEDTDPLSIPLESALSSVNNSECHGELLRDTIEASSSGLKEQLEDRVSDALCVDTGIVLSDGSSLSKSSEDVSGDAYMGMPTTLDSEQGESEDDDEGLYLAINNMPVKVEFEEEKEVEDIKIEVKEEEEVEEVNSNHVTDLLEDTSLVETEAVAVLSDDDPLEEKLNPAKERIPSLLNNYSIPSSKIWKTSTIEEGSPPPPWTTISSYPGIASTSGSEFYNANLIPDQEKIGKKLEWLTGKQLDKSKGRVKLKMHERSEDEMNLIRQKNREQKQNKRRELQEKIIFETMYGIGRDSVYDIHEIEERKKKRRIHNGNRRSFIIEKERSRETAKEKTKYDRRRTNIGETKEP